MKSSNLEDRNQEVLSEGILETTSLGLANCRPVSTGGQKGYAMNHISSMLKRNK